MDKNDWAFALTRKQFSDTTKIIVMRNYFNFSKARLRLTYNYKHKILIWDIMPESDFEKTFYLPKHVELHKCRY